MVDNFNLIRDFLKFENKGDFYFLEILQRKKDGNAISCGHHNASRIIKDYYISSLEQFDGLKDEIISKCNENNARAYLRLNKRNYRTVSLAFAELMLYKVRTSQDFRNPRVEIASVIGQHHDAGKNKTWIIDLDDVGISDPKVEHIVWTINHVEPFDISDKIVTRIPTKSGVHIISKPFNVEKFNRVLKKEFDMTVDIHNDNPTILYCP